MEHIDVPAILAYKAGEVFATLSDCRPDGLETSLRESVLSPYALYIFGLPFADNVFPGTAFSANAETQTRLLSTPPSFTPILDTQSAIAVSFSYVWWQCISPV